MRRAAWWSAMVVALTLMSPRPAAAGFLDWILELSGPEMQGFLGGCEFDLHGRDKQAPRYQCHVLDIPVTSDWAYRHDARDWVTLSLDGGIYGIFKAHDSNMGHFTKYSIWMLTYEPLINLRSDRKGLIRVEHAAGMSFFAVYPKGFQPFGNAGFKIVPVTVSVGRLSVTGNLRFFPHPFTSEQFGRPLRPDENSGPETVKSIQLGWRF